ncbi:MAG TPA: hypothetical protein PLO57_02010 [Candidatus Cloacimonadota bacterium]|nr:hypothetical protein [Candidatus Cloacimonadota bacterium]
MLFNALVDVFIADDVYFGFGSYSDSEVASINNTQSSIKDELSNSFDLLGELAEKPGKADSKITKLKTRNYTLPGKRTSTVELTISGLSNRQKNYLESSAFMGKNVTIVACSKSYDRVVIFNGLRWTVDWSGEADGLFNVVVSTEFAGNTAEKVFVFKDIPPVV